MLSYLQYVLNTFLIFTAIKSHFSFLLVIICSHSPSPLPFLHSLPSSLFYCIMVGSGSIFLVFTENSLLSLLICCCCFQGRRLAVIKPGVLAGRPFRWSQHLITSIVMSSLQSHFSEHSHFPNMLSSFILSICNLIALRSENVFCLMAIF